MEWHRSKVNFEFLEWTLLHKKEIQSCNKTQTVNRWAILNFEF